jgi:hypothetical protein
MTTRWVLTVALALPCLVAPQIARSQAVVFSTEATVDKRYLQIEPTHVDLPKTEMDARGHQDILRTLMSEQGFAMRPLPRGKKGLTLVANGKLTPAGEGYVAMVTDQGVSAKPGERVVLSNIAIGRDRLVIDLNGGPEKKHAFLRHIEIGMGGPVNTSPVIQDPGQEPVGARITLTFAGRLPDLTPAQVKALLAPLISFDMKTPVQAFTDSLPPELKDAILNHHVWVGMTTDMVTFALGQPEGKSRETEGQMPFEEWIYGHAPQDVTFVRVNGNRVVRVEIAKVGQPLEIYTKDEVEGLMTATGRPVVAQVSPVKEHTVQMGDVHRDPDTQAPAAPPSLRKPGEKLPDDDPNQTLPGSREGPMKPVIFPPKQPDPSAAPAPSAGQSGPPQQGNGTGQQAPSADQH